MQNTNVITVQYVAQTDTVRLTLSTSGLELQRLESIKNRQSQKTVDPTIHKAYTDDNHSLLVIDFVQK